MSTYQEIVNLKLENDKNLIKASSVNYNISQEDVIKRADNINITNQLSMSDSCTNKYWFYRGDADDPNVILPLQIYYDLITIEDITTGNKNIKVTLIRPAQTSQNKIITAEEGYYYYACHARLDDSSKKFYPMADTWNENKQSGGMMHVYINGTRKYVVENTAEVVELAVRAGDRIQFTDEGYTGQSCIFWSKYKLSPHTLPRFYGGTLTVGDTFTPIDCSIKITLPEECDYVPVTITYKKEVGI